MAHFVRGFARFARLYAVFGVIFGMVGVGVASTMSTTALALPGSKGSLGEGNDTPRIHLRGLARIDAHVGRAAKKPFVAGSVTDDAGRPLARTPVLLRISRESAPNVDISLSAASPAACRDGLPRPVLDSAERLVVQTDDEGRFCVRIALARDRYRARFETQTDRGAPSLLDATPTILAFDLAREAIELRFDQAPPLVALEGGPVTIDVSAISTNEDAPASTEGLVLQLSNETGAPLGEATTNAAGHARFVVPSARFGLPGNGEVRVRFAGSSAFETSSRSHAMERDTRVQVVVTNATSAVPPAFPTLPSASPEDGVSVDVVARPGCAALGCDSLPTGSIEMRVGEALIAATALHNGSAHFAASFEATGHGDILLRLRYKPDAPFYVPADDAEVLQPTRSPLPWGKFATALAGLGVIAWFVVPRLPTRRRETRPVIATVEASIERSPAPDLRKGWRGRIVDAYDGAPIAGADIRIERPGFQGSNIVIETHSIVDGTFSLSEADAHHGDQLVVSTSLHSPLQARLPTFGYLDVALKRRRHTLLDGLVTWAKRKGGRFDGRPEATPAQVREAAGARSPVGAWADALEQAVYGGAPVDSTVQEEIDLMSPERQDRTAGKPLARGRNSPA